MNIELLKHILANQYAAALSTLAHCATWCPGNLWNAKIAQAPFHQVIFHTLFFTDYYLESEPHSFKQQAYHLQNQEMFGDYEQMEDREPIERYTRDQIQSYLGFCKEKAAVVCAGEDEASLAAMAESKSSLTRVELHLYNIRHIQHHAAQLTLRLRLDSDVDIPWVWSCWKEP